MTPEPYHLLLVDDEAAARRLLALSLRQQQFDICEAGSAADGIASFGDGHNIDVVLTDLKMPGMSGIDLIRRIRTVDPECQIIVLTAFGAIETAVEAIRAGAVDYLTKPVEDVGQLVRKLQAAASHRRTLRENSRLRESVTTAIAGPLLLGESAVIRRVRRDIQSLASSTLPVLVTGPSGTGKELVARSLHLLSPRAEAPLVAVNVAAIAETLFEAELFGVEKGAFTGAENARVGFIRSADSGTLFLDEIGELSLPAQAKLLRVLEEKRVTPVGGLKEIPVDFRLIAATNRGLKEEVAAGKFREDLYFRLSAAVISLPPLSERGEDILMLARHFLSEISLRSGLAVTLHDQAAELLRHYSWPGNVRELRYTMERAVIHRQTDELTSDDFHFLSAPTPSELPVEEVKLGTLAETEAAHIRLMLAACHWNMTETATRLGIHRNTLRQKIKEYRLDE